MISRPLTSARIEICRYSATCSSYCYLSWTAYSHPALARGYSAPFDMWHSSPYTGHATHTRTLARTHARFRTLTDGSLAQITHPMSPPPLSTHCRFCYKKRKHWTEKNLPRKKIARYKGRNSPRERTMITTGWEWGVDYTWKWDGRLPVAVNGLDGDSSILWGGIFLFFRVMFASVRYVPWTVTNSLALHTRCIPKVNPSRNYHKYRTHWPC